MVPYISQGSVATCLRCGEIFIDDFNHFITNWLHSSIGGSRILKIEQNLANGIVTHFFTSNSQWSCAAVCYHFWLPTANGFAQSCCCRKLTGLSEALVYLTAGLTVDQLGLFNIGPTTRSNQNQRFFEASIHSNGNITRSLILNNYGVRRYPFVVTVSKLHLTTSFRGFSRFRCKKVLCFLLHRVWKKLEIWKKLEPIIF